MTATDITMSFVQVWFALVQVVCVGLFRQPVRVSG